MAEKQRIVLHEMKLIRAPEDDLEIPGFDELKLYPGEVISKCLSPLLQHPSIYLSLHDELLMSMHCK